MLIPLSLAVNPPIENPANHSSGVGPSKPMDFIQLILSSHLWNHTRQVDLQADRFPSNQTAIHISLFCCLPTVDCSLTSSQTAIFHLSAVCSVFTVFCSLTFNHAARYILQYTKCVQYDFKFTLIYLQCTKKYLMKVS